MPKTNEAVVALMREDAARPVAEDKLSKIRAKISEMRDLDLEREYYMEQHRAKGARLFELTTKELVDLFDEAGIDNLGIPEQGNKPAYNIEIGWIYKANLGSPAEPKVPDYDAAIAYIRKHEPDMLKTTYEVQFGMGEDKQRKEFEAFLKKQKYNYSSSFGVPWNTLTAWVKEQIENGKSPPLKMLGATVERVAKLIKPKATRAKKAAAEAKATPKGRK